MRYLVNTIILAVFLIIGQTLAAQDVMDSSSKVRTKQEGPSQYLVTCFESPQYCAEEFKRLCPDGHKVDGYFRDEYDHGQITARISCIEMQES